MGAWGSGPFDNDAAMDLLYQYEDDGVSVLHDVLKEWEDTDDFADSDLGSATIAIGEIVAAVHGKPLSSDAMSNCDAQAEQLLKHKADVAADGFLLSQVKIHVNLGLLDPEASEIAELWSEADADNKADFEAGVKDLISRLDGLAA